jgi:methionyl-tRNA formyltransferase
MSDSQPPASSPQPLRLVFMGTPEFAVPSLQTLIEGKDLVVGVVTQPDQPSGRGLVLHAPPVKVLATAHHLPVWQPDLIVVVAYGKMLPQTVLTLPPYGCINVHASLLPKYRGAAPIQWAIAGGERETGVTIMYISERMDAGDILLQKTIPIAADDTGGTLHDKLAGLGAGTLREALQLLKGGQLIARPQNEAEATYAPLIKKEAGRIDWRQDADTIERRIRAFNPWPSAYTTLHGRLLKIFAAQHERSIPLPVPPPGTVAEVTPVSLVVATGGGYLALSEVQLEGKRRLPVAEFLKGYSLTPGLVLGG